MNSIVPTRGERNRNPANINYMAAKAWNGQIGIEAVPAGEHYAPRFGVYESDFFGIRAAAKQLIADNAVHRLRTIAALIGDPTWGWAPAADRNDVDAYVNAVARAVRVLPGTPIDLTTLDFLIPVLTAVIHQENGRCLYPADLIEQACRNAIGHPAKHQSGVPHA